MCRWTRDRLKCMGDHMCLRRHQKFYGSLAQPASFTRHIHRYLSWYPLLSTTEHVSSLFAGRRGAAAIGCSAGNSAPTAATTPIGGWLDGGHGRSCRWPVKPRWGNPPVLGPAGGAGVAGEFRCGLGRDWMCVMPRLSSTLHPPETALPELCKQWRCLLLCFDPSLSSIQRSGDD